MGAAAPMAPPKRENEEKNKQMNGNEGKKVNGINQPNEERAMKWSQLAWRKGIVSGLGCVDGMGRQRANARR